MGPVGTASCCALCGTRWCFIVTTVDVLPLTLLHEMLSGLADDSFFSQGERYIDWMTANSVTYRYDLWYTSKVTYIHQTNSEEFRCGFCRIVMRRAAECPYCVCEMSMLCPQIVQALSADRPCSVRRTSMLCPCCPCISILRICLPTKRLTCKVANCSHKNAIVPQVANCGHRKEKSEQFLRR